MNVLITSPSTEIGIGLINRFLKSDFKLFLITTNDEAVYTIQINHRKNVKVINVDLLEKDSAYLVYEKLQEQKISIDLLVNIAEIEGSAKFSEKALKEYLSNIDLLTTSLLLLSLIIATDMFNRNAGKILNIGSLITFSELPTLLMETVLNENELESKITYLCQSLDNSTISIVNIYNENLSNENKIWSSTSKKYANKNLRYDKIIDVFFDIILNKKKFKLYNFFRFKTLM